MVEITESGKQALLLQISQRFPNRKDLQITNVQEITDGWETQIFSFSLAYEVHGQDFKEDLVIRFYQGNNQELQSEKEFTLMRKVQQLEIPVPRVDLLVNDNSPFGNAFIVMEKINGGTMSDALRDVPESKVHASIKLMVAKFVKLHQLPWQDIFVDQNINHDQNDRLEFINSNLSIMRDTAKKYHLDEFSPHLAWLNDNKELGATNRLSVIHNDYHPQNILIRQGSGKLAIIDWSFAEIGDYRLDLAWSVLLFGVMLGPQYREIVLAAYEELAGALVFNFEYFEVLKFTTRMLTIATWLNASVEIPVNKITKEVIHNEYKVHVLNVYDRLKEITGFHLPTIENL